MKFRTCVDEAIDAVLEQQDAAGMDQIIAYIELHFPGEQLAFQRAGLIEFIRRILKKREEIDTTQLEMWEGLRLQRCYSLGGGRWTFRRKLTVETGKLAHDVLEKNLAGAAAQLQAFKRYQAMIEPRIPPGGTYGDAEDRIAGHADPS